MIKVALTDDHAILRKGVMEIISGFDGMQVIMEAGNGKELLKKLADAKELPDICIVDINMPEMNGYDTTIALKKNYPKIKILALSMYDSEHNIIKMLRCGATGYMLKDDAPEVLKNAIQLIYETGFYHSELVTGRILHQLNDPITNISLDITEKEQQFLNLCCTELTYKEIAAQMNMSPRTIDGYREVLFNKFKSTSRTGLVVHAIKFGIVDL